MNKSMVDSVFEYHNQQVAAILAGRATGELREKQFASLFEHTRKKIMIIIITMVSVRVE